MIKHDHKFEGICAFDMSSHAVVTTDGPHFLWAPIRAKEDPPNLKIWNYRQTGDAPLYDPSQVLPNIVSRTGLVSGRPGNPVNVVRLAKPVDSCVMKCEHLLLNGEYLLTGTDLTVDNIWSIGDHRRPIKVTFPKYEHLVTPEEAKLLIDWRIRAQFLCAFFYKNDVKSGYRYRSQLALKYNFFQFDI